MQEWTSLYTGPFLTLFTFLWQVARQSWHSCRRLVIDFVLSWATHPRSMYRITLTDFWLSWSNSWTQKEVESHRSPFFQNLYLPPRCCLLAGQRHIVSFYRWSQNHLSHLRINIGLPISFALGLPLLELLYHSLSWEAHYYWSFDCNTARNSVACPLLSPLLLDTPERHNPWTSFKYDEVL